MNDIPRMLTITETANATGLAQHFIRQLCTSGKITTVRCGKKYLINFDRLVDYLNEGDKPEPPQAGVIRRIG